MTPRTDGVIGWLLDGDPAIRWQTMRDLVGAAQRAAERERTRVARDGWGARLLARQDPERHYDILRALDYFLAAGAPRDQRLAEAIDIVRNAQREDGRWSLQHSYKGKTYLELERLGAPSRWNTLRALRALKWWDRDKT